MDPNRLLQRMCDRHGLPVSEAEPLVPLVQRALASPHQVRDRILVLVETNLARKAGKEDCDDREALFADLDEEVLSSVAHVLSDWTPSSRVLDIGGTLPDLFPDGLDLGDLPSL